MLNSSNEAEPMISTSLLILLRVGRYYRRPASASFLKLKEMTLATKPLTCKIIHLQLLSSRKIYGKDIRLEEKHTRLRQVVFSDLLSDSSRSFLLTPTEF
jgi:hypothetical protein